jgi:hypothetical protein
MRSVGALRREWRMVAALLLVGATLAGCKTIEGGPDRLYPAAEEIGNARRLLGQEDTAGLVQQYYDLTNSGVADVEFRLMRLRNEIIARRMYIVDVEYTEYETALTNERQKFGFATATAAQGLAIASTLVTPLRAAQIVGGVGAGVGAARGFYDSEIVIAKTIQIAQGHMRANRADVAKRIISYRNASTIVYPLSAALHDLEDYYSAGTLTAGLVDAVGQAGEDAKDAEDAKAATAFSVYLVDDSSTKLDTFLRPAGPRAVVDTTRRKAAQSCFERAGGSGNVRSLIGDPTQVQMRNAVLSCALAKS